LAEYDKNDRINDDSNDMLPSYSSTVLDGPLTSKVTDSKLDSNSTLYVDESSKHSYNIPKKPVKPTKQQSRRWSESQEQPCCSRTPDVKKTIEALDLANNHELRLELERLLRMEQGVAKRYDTVRIQDDLSSTSTLANTAIHKLLDREEQLDNLRKRAGKPA
jgi:hypothetical protein